MYLNEAEKQLMNKIRCIDISLVEKLVDLLLEANGDNSYTEINEVRTKFLQKHEIDELPNVEDIVGNFCVLSEKYMENFSEEYQKIQYQVGFVSEILGNKMRKGSLLFNVWFINGEKSWILKDEMIGVANSDVLSSIGIDEIDFLKKIE